eukprot:CAMPEP_0185028400 /NCGR_PEP_ID=MMETSP1103-20130426/14057_1 /TAXON_ID=36769 /ORGANISM="Paraphysomonas bandaiensis, Strain Caron Lab Isolate" /LENGTH=361 /DNA_ID=CAMNT_0027562799 /DNA_START=191 /DNA_END=1276 /DNA_ORIENTATION=-
MNGLKLLEDLETSSNPDDINTYKAKTRVLFEQLLLKLEENSDQIYSLEHRVKYLEQECESKDIHIEKITVAMQEAVDDCRQEAEDMVEEMVRKVSAEVNQRRDAELLVCRLQSEVSRLKDTLHLQKLPGIEQNLDDIIIEIQERESRTFEEELGNLKMELRMKDDELQTLRRQREAEMEATISVVSAAQQKINTLHHQMKAYALAQQQQRERELARERSPLLMVPQQPREVYLSDSETLPVDCEAEPFEHDASSGLHPQGNGQREKKAVVPHKKKQRNRRSRNKKNQQQQAAAPPGSVENQQQLSPVSSRTSTGDPRTISAPTTPSSSVSTPQVTSPPTNASGTDLRLKSKTFWSGFRPSV